MKWNPLNVIELRPKAFFFFSLSPYRKALISHLEASDKSDSQTVPLGIALFTVYVLMV